MNYNKIYEDLMSTRFIKKIDRIKEKKLGAYYEGHHIIPKSKGGLGYSNRPKNNSNIVLLTAREHFLAHWLLWRIYRDRSTALAFHKMMSINKLQKRAKSARGYEEARLAFSKTNKGNSYGKGQVKVISEEQKKKQSEIMKGRYIGDKNPFYGKNHTNETLEKLRKPKSKDHIEKIKNILANKPKIKCPYCDKELDQLNAKKWHFNNCKYKILA
jgi:hypothetical protein